MQECFSPYDFERYLVNYVEALVDGAPKIDQSKFARRAFHDANRGKAAAVDHWKRMRQEVKPGRVTLEDAMRISNALGYQFNDFVDLITTKCRRHYKGDAPVQSLALPDGDGIEYGEKKAVNG